MYLSPSIAALQLLSASRACHEMAVWDVADGLQKPPTPLQASIYFHRSQSTVELA